jgi:hypothetical protein
MTKSSAINHRNCRCAMKAIVFLCLAASMIMGMLISCGFCSGCVRSAQTP